MENIYIILQQIYLGNGVPNFIRSPEFYKRYHKKHFRLFFSGHTVYNRPNLKLTIQQHIGTIGV